MLYAGLTQVPARREARLPTTDDRNFNVLAQRRSTRDFISAAILM